MADKLKAKIYMVGSTSGIEVEVDDKEKFLEEINNLSSTNHIYNHSLDDGEVALNTSLIQAIEFNDEDGNKRGAGLVSSD